jgi:GNAT superfamily N-acetyltransferase
MEITEVTTRAHIREFHAFQLKIYRDDVHWIQPVTDNIEEIFDPARNKLFRKGEAARWILTDPKAGTIGRIAAFIDRKICDKNDQPTGGIGFFECIDDSAAAFMLFDKAKEWLSERGMEAMDGPVNFGERDRWWGLLVDGFDEPNFCMPYNPPRYQQLFESYGFENYFNQYTYHRKVYDGDLDDHLKATADRIASNPRYKICHINRDNLKKYAEEFSQVYNHAWIRHSGVKEITPAHAMALLKSLKPILDERLVWFAYYDDEPVGFLIMIPEMNQVFRYVGSRLNLLGKLRFLWYFRVRKVCTKALGIIFGFVEEHQRKGLEGAMVYAFRRVALAKGFPYKEIELNWIGDFNPSMIRIVEMVGFKVKKTHVTYRYLFDRTKPFQRARKVS